MKIKKFKAHTMQEAMKTIRSQLGQNAVILNSKVVYTGGFLGMFKKKMIEVVAGIDEEDEMISGSQKEKIEHQTGQQLEMSPVLNEIKKLKDLVQSMSVNSTVIHPDLKEIEQKIDSLGLLQPIKQDVIASILETYLIHQKKLTNEQLEFQLKQELKKRISDIPFHGITFSKKFVNVVGPTGVGKTTTLAKLAAICKINYKKKIGFLTTDTYRIAAIDQLKTYAEILNAPLEVCYNSFDFQEGKKKLNDCDIVFIDTAGRNFLEQQYVQDLSETIDFQDEMETFLVFSLTSKFEDMEKVYNQFSHLPIHQFIFTKHDETSSYGAMYNIVYKTKIGAGYMTDGQDVPDDIHKLDHETFIQYLMG